MKRISLLTSTRFDSRLVLRCLIIFNVLLAVYNILTLHTNVDHKTSPCVVVINTSKGGVNDIGDNHDASANIDSKVASPLADDLLSKVDVNGMGEASAVTLPLNFSNSALVAESGDNSNNNNNNDEKLDMLAPPKSDEKETNKIWWTTETRTSYTVIRNFIPALFAPNFNSSVTLATQGTSEFLHHIEQLCQRWDGPISVAVYAPGDDFPIAITLINYLRECRDSCVKKNVSWHLVYDSLYGPSANSVSFPNEYVNNSIVNCSLTNIDDVMLRFQSQFRINSKLPYPINVVRNVARLSSKTKHLLASDIELYPSINIVSSFMKLLDNERAGLVPIVQNSARHVYMLPIFEVKVGTPPPTTKTQLLKLIKDGSAIFFHKWVCDSCQNFPGRDKWIATDLHNDNQLNVFGITKRTRERNTWEPLFIGTNDEPLYDERLSWDGKRDKMSQMYEMCLMNYDICILDNAFLVHAPGIKHIDPKDQKRRLPFIKKNNQVYNTITAKLRKKYGTKNQC